MPEPARKFFADRGPHLAAMIAYFALLSFVPLVFLALALLGFTGRVDESSFYVRELNHMFPGASIERIVAVGNTLRDNAAALGIVGGVFLLWTSLSLFSVLESAFNIVYGQPNRPFFRGKAVASAFLVASLVVLFVGLAIGTIGYRVLTRHAEWVTSDAVAYVVSVAVSTVAVFLFLLAAFHTLTNVTHSLREVLPGAVVGAVLLQLTFQALPLYIRLSGDLVVLQALGAPVILLVWLYVMANVIVFCAEINWWFSRERRLERSEDIPGLA